MRKLEKRKEEKKHETAHVATVIVIVARIVGAGRRGKQFPLTKCGHYDDESSQ